MASEFESGDRAEAERWARVLDGAELDDYMRPLAAAREMDLYTRHCRADAFGAWGLTARGSGASRRAAPSRRQEHFCATAHFLLARLGSMTRADGEAVCVPLEQLAHPAPAVPLPAAASLPAEEAGADAFAAALQAVADERGAWDPVPRRIALRARSAAAQCPLSLLRRGAIVFTLPLSGAGDVEVLFSHSLPSPLLWGGGELGSSATPIYSEQLAGGLFAGLAVAWLQQGPSPQHAQPNRRAATVQATLCGTRDYVHRGTVLVAMGQGPMVAAAAAAAVSLLLT